MDNSTLAGMTQQHDTNLVNLYEATDESNLTFNESNSVIPVQSLGLAEKSKSKQRTVGLFSQYSKCVHNYVFRQISYSLTTIYIFLLTTKPLIPSTYFKNMLQMLLLIALM